MIITNSLGSNYTSKDRALALKLLFQPWKWRDGPEAEQLKDAILDNLIGRIASFQVELFLKGRHAIYEALQTFGIRQGDEVIVQAFTCVAVVQPILDLGATPIYVDVNPKNLNPTLEQIKKIISPKTKAVILQHTLGYLNRENDQIADWCHDHKIFVIQDLAHVFGADFKPFKLFKPFNHSDHFLRSDAVILSFSQDKVIDGISGGGLIVSDNLTSLPPRLNDSNHLTLIELGKNLLYPICTWLIRSTYLIGVGKFGVGKGIHWLAKFIGLMSSPVEASAKPTHLPNALAALTLNQLNRLNQIVAHRRDISLVYNRVIEQRFKLVTSSDIKKGSNLRYPIWVGNRDELEKKLIKHGFYLMDHWYDAPVSPDWVNNSQVKYRLGSCPNAEDLSKHIFNLPTHVNISERQAILLANLING